MNNWIVLRFAPLLLTFLLIRSDSPVPEFKSLVVTATAYNSVVTQTTEIDPDITAWGEQLKPGMKSIAVSRDLIRMGLTHNTPVYIDGLDGVFYVKDKMNKRWTERIDIYMGLDLETALEWGVKEVEISWEMKEKPSDK